MSYRYCFLSRFNTVTPTFASLGQLHGISYIVVYYDVFQ